MDNVLIDQLIYAVRRGGIDDVCQILNGGADVNTQDLDGDTLLHNAAFYGKEEILKLLLDRGADVNVKNKVESTPLHLASRYNEGNICVELLNHGANINATNEEKMSPLHMAAKGGYENICITLINHGADIEARGKYERTPMHFAAISDRTAVCLALLDCGANIDSKDYLDNTPLYYAASQECDDVCCALIANSAATIGIESNDAEIKNILEMTRLQAAVAFGDTSIIVKVLNSDNDPETLSQRVHEVIELENEECKKNGKQDVSSVLLSWLIKKDALTAIRELNSENFSVSTPK